MDPIVVSARVVIPASALAFRAVRASGPGGQNVNKVSSKVELRVELDGIVGLTSEQRRRLESSARRRLDGTGGLVVASQLTRSQMQNLEDSRNKIRELVKSALIEPKLRRPTKPSRAARARRVEEKRMHSRKKESRRAREE
jgi:ribosome-associated protein